MTPTISNSSEHDRLFSQLDKMSDKIDAVGSAVSSLTTTVAVLKVSQVDMSRDIARLSRVPPPRPIPWKSLLGALGALAATIGALIASR